MCEHNTCACTNSSHFVEYQTEISLSPNVTKSARSIAPFFSPNARFRFLGQWSARIRYYVIYLRRICSKGQQDEASSLSVFPIPGVLSSLLLSSPLVAGVGSWYGYTRQFRSFSSTLHAALHISILPFPFARYIFLLMINPRYKPPS